MGSVDDISQLCRLCLVKEQVNIPIFGDNSDNGQTFVKINSCLPVKVSRDDNLPKKICDGCSYKLDMLYIFRNTSLVSEKQLITWLNQAGLSTISQASSVKDPLANAKPEIMVKQETFDTVDTRVEGDNSEMGIDTQSYIIQQQQLPYQQDFEFGDEDGSNADATDEPVPKRAKRTSTLKKAPIEETEEIEDDLDAAMQITKAEDEDSEDLDQPDYVEAPVTSADDQPGPSGVGKAAVEAPKSRCRRVSLTNYRRQKNYNESSDEDFEPLLIPTRVEIISKKWTCRKCSKEFPSRKTLTEHRKIHKPPEREQPTYKYDQTLELYVCSNCSAEFQDKEAAEKHILTHIETYTCEVCNLKFTDPYKFSCHLQQHSEDSKFKCPMCTYSTPRRTCIATHINRVHLNKFIYYCNTCGKGFNDAHRFKEHGNDHLGIKPFICVVCNKAFSYSKYLQIHQIRYHTVGIKGQLLKNQCSICRRVFSRNDTLDKHMATRHSKKYPLAKKHLCDMCGKGFATNEKFKIHYRTHTGVKPFACKFCEKCFIKRDYLIMHERVHTGEKPYVCHHCGKSFNQGAPLKIHIRSHTGERPYICQLCNVGFVSKGSLNMHKKMCRAY